MRNRRGVTMKRADIIKQDHLDLLTEKESELEDITNQEDMDKARLAMSQATLNATRKYKRGIKHDIKEIEEVLLKME